MSQLAYLNGDLIPDENLAVSVYDAGFVQGVTVSEQLRTFGGHLFRLQDHLIRLTRSLEIIGVKGVDLDALGEEAEALAAHNHSLMNRNDDLGLSIFVTPGQSAAVGGDSKSRPTVGMCTAPLPFHRWSAKYRGGEHLVVSRVRQIPSECWPAELKCRSRMHYYLADRQVQSEFPNARALLLDQDGFVAEASTASVLQYRAGEGIVAPPADKVLPSVSVSVLKSLCADLSIPFVHRDISPEEMETADEVLLSSTSPCLLPVTTVNSASIASGTPGQIFQKLHAAWNDLVGLNIIGQASDIGAR